MSTDDTALTFDQGTMVLAGWTDQAMVKVFGEQHPWRWDARSRQWRCEAWYYYQVRERLQMRAWGVVDAARQWQSVRWPTIRLPAPRPEQQAAIDAWSDQPRGVIVMPTGTGKTEVALHLMARCPCSTLVVAPVRDLMYQWHRRIRAGLGYDAGVIGDNTFNARPVSVTTYDSAAIHAAKLGNRFELIVFDECHHLPGDFRREAALMSLAPNRMGLTATPERSDGRHTDLNHLIGPVVYRLPLAHVRGKTLADFDVVRIPVFLSEQEQQRYDGLADQIRQYMQRRREEHPQFTWQDLCAETADDLEARQALVAYRHKQAIEDRAEEKLRVLEDLFRLHAGTPMLIFTGSNAMAFDVSRRFLIPCLLSHCGKKERLDILEGFQAGRYPAIVANQVLDEGVDLPETKVAVVIGGSASSKQAQQRLGRILRPVANRRAVLYEVVCNDTNEVKRSRRRRKNDAYARTRHRRL